jgi:hypothetical protein
MALQRGGMSVSDFHIDKLWLGYGKGNVLVLTHEPSGITIRTKPIRGDDPDWYSREEAKLLDELERQLKRGGHGDKAI